MNCQEVMELMQRQLDDDLDESEKEVLMSHTRQCPDCAAMFERLQLLSAELTSLPKVVPSYSLVDAIMPQLERMELFGQPEADAEPAPAVQAAEALPRRTKRERRWPSIRIMSGVIAAGIVAGLFLVTYKPDSSPDLSSTAKFTANESSNAAADMQADVPKELSFKGTQSDDAALPDVSTEAVRKQDIMGDKSFVEDNGDSSRNMSNSSGGSESGTGSIPSKAIKPDGSSNGSAEGGSNPSQGIAGEQGGELGITSQNSAVVSPDGKYSGEVVGFGIKLFAVSDQSLLFESPRKNGKLANLSWSEDSSKLTYEVQVEKGAIEKYVIDLATFTEQKAAH
jgi:hypothetical protein